ncbi:hypothetical protein OAP42_01210 [Candidatus Marinimicrobia bacterium]|jgi:hypothetical protein|nr:hypothetical protein [Candidatus Neomarinimicrobiota bacterium]
MEAFGILGFVFGITALSKVIILEKKIKELVFRKEETKLDDKSI